MCLDAIKRAYSAAIGNAGAKFLLVTLAEHARDAGDGKWTCYPSVKRLAELTAQGERTAERHLAWLITEGWISREVRQNRRHGGSAYFYTLHLAEAKIGGEVVLDLNLQTGQNSAKMAATQRPVLRQFGADHPPISTGTPAKLALAYIEEPVTEPVNEPDAPKATNDETRFAEFWSAYPRKVEERGARTIFLNLIRRGDASVDALIEGVKRYAVAVRGCSPQFIKSPTNWLNRGCWADGAPSSAQAVASGERPIVAFRGPADVWDAIASAKGPDWAMSYLAPCAWSSSSRALIPRTSFAAGKLRDELGGLLGQLSVTIVESPTTIGAAHVR
ncbi:helix-turn-helix domain-containing protein [Caulobacter sp. ErkDOM-E]|uniref:helix-turn-helix domain-containing protein n=1 Tax=Caulobacter sp. ErkDOM-E TaxID=3402778 RepID=UPI003AF69FC0